MVSWLLKIVVAFLGIYAVIPTLLARLGHVGVVWRTSPGLGGVALTFDDGPDPVYTPQVLEVLRQYGAQACFFVLGEKARRYPDLVDRMLAEGHEVANHGYTHHPYCLLLGTPLREVERSSKAIEEVTGRRPRLFRPPWGMFNACTLWPRFLYGQRVVLWSFMSQDWWQMRSPEQIARLVLRLVRDGSILVFHDSDTTFLASRGSTAKMLAALPLILAGLQKKGLAVVNMNEIIDNDAPALHLRPVRRLWEIWEKFFEKLAGISDPGGPDCLFRLAVRKYAGKPLVLPDGTKLVRGDLLAELHMKNDEITALTAGARAEKSAVIVARAAQNSLPHMAAVLKDDPRFREVKAVVGYTMLHRGIRKIGFAAYDLPRVLRTAVSLYEWWLMVVYHQNGWAHVRQYWRKLVPKMVIISRGELLARQGEKNPPGAAAAPEEKGVS